MSLFTANSLINYCKWFGVKRCKITFLADGQVEIAAYPLYLDLVDRLEESTPLGVWYTYRKLNWYECRFIKFQLKDKVIG